jgi:hypothetical protein
VSVFVMGSLHGAPGVSTTALLLAGCFTRGLLVEADSDGGVLAVRHGLSREPGLTTMAGARTATGWFTHAQSMGGVPVLVGPESPERMVGLWAHAGERLVTALTVVDGDGAADAVIDVGRFRSGWPPAALSAAASKWLVVVRPEAEELVTLAQRLPGWVDVGLPVAVVLAGTGPYSSADVVSALGVEVAATLPVDRRAASIITGGGSRRVLVRSALGRAVRSLADTLAQSTTTPSQDGLVAGP